METVLSKFRKVKHFILDVDGVLTDGSLLLQSDGHFARTMNIRDGYAMQLAIKKGYDIVIISGGTSNAVEKRLKSLGLKHVYMAVENKLEVFQNLSSDIQPANALYMGDDMPDLAIMKSVGLSSCPADACNEVKEVAHYVSPLQGGKGCVRDVIEKVLKLNDDWQ